MHQNYVCNLTLVCELARLQKFGNVQTNRLTNKLTNRQTDILKKQLFSRKIYFFRCSLIIRAFLWTEMPWFRSIFLIKIVSAFYKIFRKKEAKKPLFSCTITILDHTLYGKLNKVKK